MLLQSKAAVRTRSTNSPPTWRQLEFFFPPEERGHFACMQCLEAAFR